MNEFLGYSRRLEDCLAGADWSGVEALAKDVLECWGKGRRLFLCGNGGSAGNAIHLANDFLYGVADGVGRAIDVTALSANPAVITCLANDVGYEEIFSRQLASMARPGDLLIALSGSGNSPNILRALEEAKAQGMRSYAILGFSGGKAKRLADVAIHFEIDDMQISEDLQLVVGHMLMQWLRRRNPAQGLADASLTLA